MKIFISHPIKDEKLALELKSILESSNEIEEAFVAQRIKKYDIEISKKITEQIDSSDYVVGIITKNSINSASVNQELGYAQGTKKPKIPMIGKNAKKGVLIYGKDVEEFDSNNFVDVCKNVRDYIIEHGPTKISRNTLSEDEKNSIFSSMEDSIPDVYKAFRRFSMVPLDDNFQRIVLNDELVDWLRQPPRYCQISTTKLSQNEFHYIGKEEEKGLRRFGLINENGMFTFQELLHYDRRISIEREMSFLLSMFEFCQVFFKKISYQGLVLIKYHHAAVENFEFSTSNPMDDSFTVQKANIKIFREEQLPINSIQISNSILEEFARACNWSPKTGTFIKHLQKSMKENFPN